jgi:hypothetical protein
MTISGSKPQSVSRYVELSKIFSVALPGCKPFEIFVSKGKYLPSQVDRIEVPEGFRFISPIEVDQAFRGSMRFVADLRQNDNVFGKHEKNSGAALVGLGLDSAGNGIAYPYFREDLCLRLAFVRDSDKPSSGCALRT